MVPPNRYSDSDIESIAAKLRDMPKVNTAPTRSKADVVQKLSGEIEELRRRGYTFDQIAEALCGSGLNISTATLRNYIYRAKSKRAAPKRATVKAVTKQPKSKKGNPNATTGKARFNLDEETSLDDL